MAPDRNNEVPSFVFRRWHFLLPYSFAAENSVCSLRWLGLDREHSNYYDSIIRGIISRNIPRGSFTAIVGASGSGRSTIFRLLLGLEEPESGGIFYSGMNLNTLKLQSLHQQLGVVMQSTQLLPGTIYENIAGQCYGLSRDEAWAIAEKVGMPQNYIFSSHVVERRVV